MANRFVGPYLRTNLPGIGWRHCRAVFGANNNITPHVLLRPDGTEELHPEAIYYLSYCSGGRKGWENLGNNPSGAMRALEKKRARLAYIAMGGKCWQVRMRPQGQTLAGNLRRVTWRARRISWPAASPAWAGELPSPLAGSSLMIHSSRLTRSLARVEGEPGQKPWLSGLQPTVSFVLEADRE
jgi:hypothetical protein